MFAKMQNNDITQNDLCPAEVENSQGNKYVRALNITTA
jgi:hypothetical protein